MANRWAAIHQCLCYNQSSWDTTDKRLTCRGYTMDISEVLTSIGSRSDCIITPPHNLPLIAPDHCLPADVHAFYLHCGGLQLFITAPFPTEIVAAEKLQLANPIIFDGVSDADLDATRDDRWWSWYLIAVGPNSQYITIDFHRSPGAVL
jgi:hypothetical protein